MFVVFTVLVCMFILYIIVRNVRLKNWSLVWSSYGNEDYFQVVAKLKSEGISFRIETPYRGISTRTDRFRDNTQYDIYVKKEVEHQALAVLHRNI